jgi:hypothetical protein
MESTEQRDKLRVLYYLPRAYYINYAHTKANFCLCVTHKLLYGSVSMVMTIFFRFQSLTPPTLATNTALNYPDNSG